jgi:antitoxin component YwqK of YwqJK toxin-antitoxin module
VAKVNYSIISTIFILQGYIMRNSSLFISSLFISFLSLFLFTACGQSTVTPYGDKVVQVQKEYFTGGKISSEFLMIDKTGQNGTMKKYGYEGKVTSISRIRNGVKDGIEVLYDGQSRPIRRTPYVNGRIHGTYTELYPNGDTMITIPFVHSLQEGEAYAYNKDGSIERTVIYSQGKIIN